MIFTELALPGLLPGGLRVHWALRGRTGRASCGCSPRATSSTAPGTGASSACCCSRPRSTTSSALRIRPRATPRARRALAARSAWWCNLGLLWASSSTSTSSSTRRASFLRLARASSAHPATLAIVLPVGISFYTFQTLRYTIDVYRGKLEPTRSAARLRALRHLLPAARGRPDRARGALPAAARARSASSRDVARARAA